MFALAPTGGVGRSLLRCEPLPSILFSIDQPCQAHTMISGRCAVVLALLWSTSDTAGSPATTPALAPAPAPQLVAAAAKGCQESQARPYILPRCVGGVGPASCWPFPFFLLASPAASRTRSCQNSYPMPPPASPLCLPPLPSPPPLSRHSLHRVHPRTPALLALWGLGPFNTSHVGLGLRLPGPLALLPLPAAAPPLPVPVEEPQRTLSRFVS